jgi:hypothetical protein
MERKSTADVPRLLDQVRELIRIRHYSIRTEQAYVQWICRFILFHGKRHPSDMGGEELTAFLSHFASQRNAAASTQNQALNAILFLYRDVLKTKLPRLDDCNRGQSIQRLNSQSLRNRWVPPHAPLMPPPSFPLKQWGVTLRECGRPCRARSSKRCVTS